MPHRHTRRAAESAVAAVRDLGQTFGVLALASGALLVEAAQPLRLDRGVFAMLDDGRLVVAVAAEQAVDHAEPGIEFRDGARIVVDALGQAARLVGDVGQLRLEAGQPLGEGLEARVEAGEATRLLQRDRGGVARAGALLGQGLAQRGRSPGDRLAVLGRRQPAADLVGLAGPQAARPRSRTPRARGGRAGGPPRAGPAPRHRAPPGSRASARRPSAIACRSSP